MIFEKMEQSATIKNLLPSTAIHAPPKEAVSFFASDMGIKCHEVIMLYISLPNRAVPINTPITLAANKNQSFLEKLSFPFHTYHREIAKNIRTT